jgi:hypothetical protein
MYPERRMAMVVIVINCVVRDAAAVGSPKNVGAAVIEDSDSVDGIGGNGKAGVVGGASASRGNLGSDDGRQGGQAIKSAYVSISF